MSEMGAVGASALTCGIRGCLLQVVAELSSICSAQSQCLLRSGELLGGVGKHTGQPKPGRWADLRAEGALLQL